MKDKYINKLRKLSSLICGIVMFTILCWILGFPIEMYFLSYFCVIVLTFICNEDKYRKIYILGSFNRSKGGK